MSDISKKSFENYSHIVTPGEVIQENASNFLRGHGTYELDGKLRSSLCGRVDRVIKLICVTPTRQRYSGEVGDLVVGRIVSVEPSFWKVDIQSKSYGRLQLSSISMPDGVQRRKTVQDQLKMRSLFKENDVIVAEVQQILFNSVCSLQTRSAKYGKVSNGVFVSVNCGLIKKCKRHFHKFPFGVHLIMGKNGYIWIEIVNSGSDRRKSGGFYSTMKSGEEAHEKISVKDRENICRVRNAILALEDQQIQIYPKTIMDVIEVSSAMKPKEMLAKTELICQKAKKRIEKKNFQDLMELREDEDEFSFR